jgi:uncharacterized membrane protein YedE/YeeE
MNKEIIAAIVAGLFFGAGLALSGMADPARVRGFLDIFGGNWDPTLMFVMGGAVVVMAVAWIIQRGMIKTWLGTDFSLPPTTTVDRPLIMGSVIFGIGWGVAGLCPGPALIGLVLEPFKAGIFVISMIAGMLFFKFSRVP